MDDRPGPQFRTHERVESVGRKRRFRGALLIFLFAACGLMLPSLASPLGGKEKPTTYVIPLPSPPDFSQVDWLIGNWSGKTTTRDPQGDIHFSAVYDLGKRVMVLRETVSLPAKETVPAVNETWMGVLSDARPSPGFILTVYSSTGFVSRIRVSVEGAEAHFNPEGGDQLPPGWLFRRVLSRTDADQFTESVQAAPPQKAFFDYYTAKFTRTKPPDGKSK
jgi:hypothetical protein